MIGDAERLALGKDRAGERVLDRSEDRPARAVRRAAVGAVVPPADAADREARRVDARSDAGPLVAVVAAGTPPDHRVADVAGAGDAPVEVSGIERLHVEDDVAGERLARVGPVIVLVLVPEAAVQPPGAVGRIGVEDDVVLPSRVERIVVDEAGTLERAGPVVVAGDRPPDDDVIGLIDEDLIPPASERVALLHEDERGVGPDADACGITARGSVTRSAALDLHVIAVDHDDRRVVLVRLVHLHAEPTNGDVALTAHVDPEPEVVRKFRTVDQHPPVVRSPNRRVRAGGAARHVRDRLRVRTVADDQRVAAGELSDPVADRPAGRGLLRAIVAAVIARRRDVPVGGARDRRGAPDDKQARKGRDHSSGEKTRTDSRLGPTGRTGRQHLIDGHSGPMAVLEVMIHGSAQHLRRRRSRLDRLLERFRRRTPWPRHALFQPRLER